MKQKSSLLPKSSKNKTAIVAEIGVNHNNNTQTCFSLINQAKISGADFVKFQLWEEGHWDDIEIYRHSWDEFQKIIAYCNKIGIAWFATAFDRWSVEKLSGQGQMIWKVPSSLIINEDYIKLILEQKGNYILSMGYLSEEEEIDIIGRFGGRDKILVHCVAEYPSRLEDANIEIINKIKPFEAGLSCHYPGIAPAVGAAALGATFIEKHITLGRDQQGPDHKASITIAEFKLMVDLIREIDIALGDISAGPTKAELAKKEQVKARYRV